MIEVEKLLQILESNSIKYFTGVPDSVLKETDYYLNKKKRTSILLLLMRDRQLL